MPSQATAAPPPQIPIEAIREIVRAEIAPLHQATADAAMRGAAIGVAQSKHLATAGVLQAIASLLAVRLLLLIAISGGLALAILTLRAGTYQADGVLAAYAVFVVLPLVVLERNPRVNKPDAN